MRRLLYGWTALAGIGGVLLSGAAAPAKADDCDRYDRYRYEDARYYDRDCDRDRYYRADYYRDRDCDRDRYYRTYYRDCDRDRYYRGSNVRVDLDFRLGRDRAHIRYHDRGHGW